MQRLSFIVGVGVIIALLVVRAFGLGTDLWLDELRSVNEVRALKSPVQIFSQLREDNNHPLNSLWIYAVGPKRPDWSYRLLSYFAGLGAVIAGAWAARAAVRAAMPTVSEEAGRWAGIICALLLASCYLFSLYTTEARGYGPALCLGLVAVGCLLSADPLASRWPYIAGYGAACVFGLLAHAVFLPLILAGPIWTGLHLWQRRAAWTEHLRAFARWHAGPFAFAVAYGVLFLGKIVVSGGTPESIGQVVHQLACFTLGLPEATPAAVSALLLALIVLACVGLTWRSSRPLAAYYAAAIAVFPVLLFVVSRQGVLYPRYFILGAACLAVALAQTLALLVRGRASGWLAGLAVAGLIAGNAVHFAKLIRLGRGAQQACFRYIIDHTPGNADVSVCGEHDGRVLEPLIYYMPRLIPGRNTRYMAHENWRKNGAQWFLVYHFGKPVDLPAELRDPTGNVWRREAAWSHAPLSGGDWLVYRNVEWQ